MTTVRNGHQERVLLLAEKILLANIAAGVHVRFDNSRTVNTEASADNAVKMAKRLIEQSCK